MKRIGHEYPLRISYGGIETCVHLTARLMTTRGHSVQVFAAGPVRTATESMDNVSVSWLQEDVRLAFPRNLLTLAARHRQRGRWEGDGKTNGAFDLCSASAGLIHFRRGTERRRFLRTVARRAATFPFRSWVDQEDWPLVAVLGKARALALAVRLTGRSQLEARSSSGENDSQSL